MDDLVSGSSGDSVDSTIQQVSLKLESAIFMVRGLRDEHAFECIRRVLIAQPAGPTNVFNLLAQLQQELNKYMFSDHEQKAS
jgi:hypothetical protein